MIELIEILKRKNKDWAKECVFVIDNAAYHSSTSTIEMLSRYDVPILFLGSYSYLMAPIELFWGLFKNADLNPNNVSTTKSKFFILTNPLYVFVKGSKPV